MKLTIPSNCKLIPFIICIFRRFYILSIIEQNNKQKLVDCEQILGFNFNKAYYKAIIIRELRYGEAL